MARPAKKPKNALNVVDSSDLAPAKPKGKGAAPAAKGKGPSQMQAIAQALGVDPADITPDIVQQVYQRLDPNMAAAITNPGDFQKAIAAYGDAAKWQAELGIQPKQAPAPQPSSSGSSASPEKGDLKARRDELKALGMGTSDIDQMGMNTRDENIKQLKDAQAQAAQKKAGKQQRMANARANKKQAAAAIDSSDTPSSVPESDSSDSLPPTPESSSVSTPAGVKLSPREQLVLDMMKQNRGPQDIAAALQRFDAMEALKNQGPINVGQGFNNQFGPVPSLSAASNAGPINVGANVPPPGGGGGGSSGGSGGSSGGSSGTTGSGTGTTGSSGPDTTTGSGTDTGDTTDPSIVKNYPQPSYYNPFGYHPSGKDAVKTPNIGRRVVDGVRYYGPAALGAAATAGGLYAGYKAMFGGGVSNDDLDALLEEAARERQAVAEKFGNRGVKSPLPMSPDMQPSPENNIRNLRQP